MNIAIHQPNYLPWQGFFDKMSRADAFVIFDDVQLANGRSYTTRCTINSANGPLELNIPVEGRGEALIKDTRLAAGRWRSKHLKSIMLSYGKAARCDELADVYSHDWTMLLDFNLALIRLLAGWIGIRARIVLSSDLNVEGHGTEKILGIVKALRGDTYISGSGAGSRRYVSEDVFKSRGVNLVWHSFTGPKCSAIDCLLGHKHGDCCCTT